MGIYDNVFSHFRFGNVEVKNRIEVPPMLPSLASPEGFVTSEMAAFYQSLAAGGAGIVTVGDAAIDNDYARGHNEQLQVGEDRAIQGLSMLAETVHKYGAVISIELNHSGRLVSPKFLNGKNPIGPSAIPPESERLAALMEGREAVQVVEMTQDMIDQVVDNFASAAYRCLVAGFKMVMIHGAHGHLISQFASPSSNKRTDGYGGSLENRARFAVEVLTAVRKKIGDKLALEYRISADEMVPDGMHEEETTEFIKIIQDKIDLVHVSLAGVDPRYIHYMAQPTYFPYAYNAHRAEKIKKAVHIPVVTVGSIIDLAMADKIISEGKADIVAMGRSNLADPEMVNKTQYGQVDDIRPCLRCNICGEQPRYSLPIRCAVNPVIGREIEYQSIQPATTKKKVVIVGGGPAGMEAAQTASSRGHNVVLYERERELGGALRYAAAPMFKADMKRYLEWMIKKTKQSPVQIKLSAEATASMIENDRPDVLILALGAEPLIPDIPGIKKPNVVWAGDVDIGNVKTGQKVIVAGAGLTGCETALYLAQQGKKIMIVDMITEAEMANDASGVVRATLLELLQKHGVEFKTEVKLEEITDKGIVVADRQSKQLEIQADSVVLSLGVESRYKEVESLRTLAPEVYIIGDCLSPRNLMAAIHDAFDNTVAL